MTTLENNYQFFLKETSHKTFYNEMISGVEYLIGNIDGLLFNIYEGSGVSQSTYVCFQYENPNDDSEYCMIEIRFSDHESGVIKNHDYNWVFGWPLEKNLSKVMQVINDNI